MKAIISLSLLMISTFAYSQDILRITKNRTPKNELHYKANIENCEFKTPGVSGYWLMGEEDGHLEDLLKSELKMYAPRISYQKASEVDFTIGAMDRLGSQVPNKTIKVRMVDCQPKAYLEVKGTEIEINEIYVQIKLISVDYMIINGINPDGSVAKIKIDL